MEKIMTKVEVYNSDYTKLNHAYIIMYEMYEKLIQCDDADEEILVLLENILRPLNPALDKIKSEMTVQTRFKDGSSDDRSLENKNSPSEKTVVEKTKNGGKIFKGLFK